MISARDTSRSDGHKRWEYKKLELRMSAINERQERTFFCVVTPGLGDVMAIIQCVDNISGSLFVFS